MPEPELELRLFSTLTPAVGEAPELADPRLSEEAPGTWLVVYGMPPTDDELAALASAASIRWCYRRLGIVEVLADGLGTLHGLPGVIAARPAWRSIRSGRPVAASLELACRMADGIATGQVPWARHPDDAPYPVVEGPPERRMLSVDPALRLPTPAPIVPVVSLSLGPAGIGYPTDPSDVVVLAMQRASQDLLVVVAAGNSGAAAADTMSAWARPEWVLSVGATADAAGTQLAGYSSRGEPGPDVVAYGASALNERRLGTSYAAPRVAGLAKVIAGAFLQLAREVHVALGGDPIGVPAVGHAMVDAFGDAIWDESAGHWGHHALPLVGVRVGAAQALAAAGGSPLRVQVSPPLLRSILLGAARPVPGASQREVGAGFLDLAPVLDLLATFSADLMYAWFMPVGSPAPPAELAELRVFDRGGLEELADAVFASGPAVQLDYETQRFAVVPIAAEARAAEPDGFGFPLDDLRPRG